MITVFFFLLNVGCFLLLAVIRLAIITNKYVNFMLLSDIFVPFFRAYSGRARKGIPAGNNYSGAGIF
jgi:hypothetical protein